MRTTYTRDFRAVHGHSVIIDPPFWSADLDIGWLQGEDHRRCSGPPVQCTNPAQDQRINHKVRFSWNWLRMRGPVDMKMQEAQRPNDRLSSSIVKGESSMPRILGLSAFEPISIDRVFITSCALWPAIPQEFRLLHRALSSSKKGGLCTLAPFLGSDHAPFRRTTPR